jgi:hypothetical protein
MCVCRASFSRIALRTIGNEAVAIRYLMAAQRNCKPFRAFRIFSYVMLFWRVILSPQCQLVHVNILDYKRWNSHYSGRTCGSSCRRSDEQVCNETVTVCFQGSMSWKVAKSRDASWSLLFEGSPPPAKSKKDTIPTAAHWCLALLDNIASTTTSRMGVLQDTLCLSWVCVCMSDQHIGGGCLFTSRRVHKPSATSLQSNSTVCHMN